LSVSTEAQAQPPPEETVTLEIDGQEVSVPKGTLVIRAAEQLGVVIPRFCDHPLLDPAGACRQCIVEIEDQPKPMTSCTTEAQDGMVVRTHLTSEMAKDAQEAQLEFLLINHPLDCPMCDKGGECPLQDQALAHGPGESRFIDEKRRYEKPVAVSPNVLLDRERCVLCARCTRFANQISGDPFIELFERGALQQVAIFEDEPYFSYFSGNVIQICPVGALTSASYRFRARPFDLESEPSVCDLCSAGCNVNLHTRRGGVMRQMARENMAVNEAWNCDKGRFAFKFLGHPRRLRHPTLRSDGALVETSWSEALDRATSAIEAAGAGRVAVLTGGRLPDEDAFVLSRYTRSVLGTDDVDFRTWGAGPDEDAALAAIVTRGGATYEDIDVAPVIVLVGLDPEEEVPILYLRLRKAWLKNDARIVSVGPRAGSIDEITWQRVRTPIGGEADALARIRDAMAVVGGDEDPESELGRLAATFADAGERTVILVGERGTRSRGALATAARLADELGAKVSWVPRRSNARGALEAGLTAGLLPGGRRIDAEDDRRALTEAWGAVPGRVGRGLRAILEAAAAGEIDVLHLVGVDLLRDCDRPSLAARALDRVGTVISQDLLETATVQRADIVLPATATHERDGTLTNWEGRRQTFRGAVPSPDRTLDDWDILTQLASRLGHPLGYRSLDDIREDIAALRGRGRSGGGGDDTRGSAGDGASRSGGWSEGAAVGSDRDDASGATPAEGGTSPGAEEGDSPGAEEGSGTGGGDATDDALDLLTYPLLLDYGVMSVGAADLLRTAKEAFAAVNPEDAARLGIADGQAVVVSSAHAELTVSARIEDDVVPGVVYVPMNSTAIPANALLGDDGAARVRVRPIDDRVAAAFRGGAWVSGDTGLTDPDAPFAPAVTLERAGEGVS
jgi:NADH-quinone oxidoreductase subunit G